MIEINEANRDLYGGDIAITRSIPAIHPKLGIPLDGTRKSVEGASSYYGTFWRGDIIYKPDPTLEFNFTRFSDDGTPNSKRLWLLLTIEKGFEEAAADQWDLRPELRKIYSVVDNRLCLPVGRNAVGKEEYEVVLVRPAARFFAEETRMMREATKILPDTTATRLASSIDGERGVSVLPPQMTQSEHRYDVGDVRVKLPA